MTDSSERTDTGLETDLVAWLEEHWDPDLTVAEWWDRLGTSGWAAPSWPAKWYGKGLSPSEAVRAQQAIAEFGALGLRGARVCCWPARPSPCREPMSSGTATSEPS